MLIVTMAIAWAKGSADRRTQYCWHLGEPFPVLRSWLEDVERLYADGHEAEILCRLIPVGDPTKKSVDIEGADAAYACEIMLASYKRV